MNALTAGLAGLIFGSGLVISGMTDPNRVLAFLDVTGEWDPTLAFVMAGAIAIAAPAFALGRRKQPAALGDAIALPPRRPVTLSLAAGAAIFGVGWGLSGICPGPSIVLLSTVQLKALTFVGAALGGIWLGAALTSKPKE